jgi:hypothetical protein
MAAQTILWVDLRTTVSEPDLCSSLPKAYGARRLRHLPDLLRADGSPPSAVPLDSANDRIRVETWVVIDRPELNDDGNVTGKRTITYHQVTGVLTASMSTDAAFTAKSTQLTLTPQWLSELSSSNLSNALGSPDLLRGTVIYAQSEKLDLTDEPLDTDVEKRTIELDGLYDGLESGRWIIVSGERTDIPNTTGVTASELVMVSSVVQGSRAPLCALFPAGLIPFSKIYYTTDANTLGDRLVVGALGVTLQTLTNRLPLPNEPNQQYCDQVQLAPGVYASAYVPTPAELLGDFSTSKGYSSILRTANPTQVDRSQSTTPLTRTPRSSPGAYRPRQCTRS